MTCYMRHMDWLFADLGLSVDAENRQRLDLALREVLELPEGLPCNGVWAEIKTLDGDGWAEIMHELRAQLGLSELQP